MGCKQSSVVEQVETPAAEAPVAVEEPAPEVAVEAAPASTQPAVEEPAAEEPKAEEPKAEEPPAAAVEEPAAVAEPEAAPVEPAPVSATVSEVASSTEATTGSETHEEVVEVTEAAAPAVEPVAEEPVAESAAAPEPAAPAPEPETESAPVDETKEEEPAVSFTSAGVSVESGVVFYQFSLVDKTDPAKDVTIKKRFNQFKTLHEEIAKLMASESNVPASQSDKFATYPALPPLPKAGATSVLFGRKNKSLTADREAQFGKILNAVARHPVAYGSPVFQAFLA